MVGGYVILTKAPIKIGENDMVAMYGSLQAANDRLNEVSSSKKPILVYVKYSTKLVPYRLDFGGVNDVVSTLVSEAVIITYNETTGILNVVPRN